MKSFDPKENLQKEYEDNLSCSYNYWIALALAKGGQNVVFQFLQRVPNTAKKGHDLDIMDHIIIYIIHSGHDDEQRPQ